MAYLFPHDDRKPPQILVVDDDEMLRELVVECIREEGYVVDVCGDGADALKRNEEARYDLIITDMRLPSLDGLSLIRKLKSKNSSTDVIVITGYGSIENAVECMKAGALEYLIKPFTIDQIVVSVHKALELRELRRRALESEFYRELAYVDALTGVRNRRYFDEALEDEITKAEKHTHSLLLFLIDIDYFKVYNDHHGHQQGDDALTRMAQLFKTTCRGSDIVTRYGGEEFAILFPGPSLDNAPELARRILKEVRCCEFNGQECLPSGSLTVSIGMACYPNHAKTGEKLLLCADRALYEAKRAGKDRAVLGKPTDNGEEMGCIII
jgi:diguanylate cyclase (GGDEF)-like protein